MTARIFPDRPLTAAERQARHRAKHPMTEEQKQHAATYNKAWRQRNPPTTEQKEARRLARLEQRRANPRPHREYRNQYNAELVALYQEVSGNQLAYGEGIRARYVGMAIKRELKKEMEL